MLHRNFKQSLIFFLVVTFISSLIFGQQEESQTNKWITNWYLFGPIELGESQSEVDHLEGFENDFLLLRETCKIA